MGKFKPRELRSDASPEDLRRQLNEIQKELAQDLAALAAASPVTPLQTSGYTARYGDIVRVAPPAAGLRVILPPVNRAQPNGRVSVIVEATTGALTVEAVDTTVDGAASVTYGKALGLIEFRLTDTGWYAFSLDLLAQPIAAKSVWANATNASAVPAALAGTGAFQYLRVNSANTGLEWAVLSLASFPAQASDTFLGNVSGSSAVPSAVNLSSLAGTDLSFGSHALSVSSTWSSVLGRGANSGAHNPIVDASQWLGFGSNPSSLSTGQIRADGDWTAHSNGVALLSGDGGAALASSGGDINLVTLFGNIKLETVLGGRVAIPSGFLDYTGQSSSTPSVASGHGLVWTKTDSPSRLYFTDDGNADNELAYVSDITGITNSQLANVASDTVKGNVSGSTGAPSDLNLSSLAGAGLSFSGHKFVASGASGFPRLDASLTPVVLFDFDSRVTDLSGNGLTPSGTTLFQLLWRNMAGLSCRATALARSSYDASLAILGDCTIESIVCFTPGIAASSVYLAYMGVNGGATSDNNFNYAINVSYTPTGPSFQFQWFSQHGTKVSDTFSVTTGLVPPDGTPFHLVGTRTSDVIRFYMNGVLIGTSSALTTPTVTGTASRFNVATLGSLCGQLGLAVYNSALSAAQVKARYNASLGQVFGTI